MIKAILMKTIMAVAIALLFFHPVFAGDKAGVEVKESIAVELPVMNYSKAIVHKVCVDGLLFLLVENGGMVQVMRRDENSGHIYPQKCEGGW